MKNQTLPNQVRRQIEEIKNSILPLASIPNSRLFQRAELIEAEAVLQYAKTLNRTVRKASAGESEFSRNNQKQENAGESLADYLTRSQAAEILSGLKESTILFYHRKGLIAGKKINRRIYFEKSEIYRFQASRVSQNIQPRKNITKLIKYEK